VLDVLNAYTHWISVYRLIQRTFIVLVIKLQGFLFQGAFKGLSMFGEAVVSSMTGAKPAPAAKKVELVPSDENGHRPGIVSVVDLKMVAAPHRDMVGFTFLSNT
jgi:hypothetical protein